ncbi:hypothetical protein, partial [uncultured Victivallis sp.]|uniref:hypothetical protein n=1 Tax=uncultured Victivallis sp. TaxID=354118 RepID=UPI0025EFB246
VEVRPAEVAGSHHCNFPLFIHEILLVAHRVLPYRFPCFMIIVTDVKYSISDFLQESRREKNFSVFLPDNDGEIAEFSGRHGMRLCISRELQTNRGRQERGRQANPSDGEKAGILPP